MFRCQICSEVVPAGTPTQSVIARQRSKEYPSRSQKMGTGRGRFQREKTIDRGGQGHEIVRELKVCPSCAEKYESVAAPPPPPVVEVPEETVEVSAAVEDSASEASSTEATEN